MLLRTKLSDRKMSVNDRYLSLNIFHVIVTPLSAVRDL